MKNNNSYIVETARRVVSTITLNILKILVLLLVVIIGENKSQTFNGWIDLNPPTRKPAFCVQFVNANTGYVGSMGFPDSITFVLKTTDAGNSWHKQPIGSTRQIIQALQFLNPDTGFGVGDSLTVRMTTNGGKDWISRNPILPRPYAFNALHFLNSETGYIAGGMWPTGEVILKTTNGGIYWITQMVTQIDAIESIRFIDITTGYATSANHIYRTTNAGDNWILHQHLYQCQDCFFYQIKFINSLTGFIVASDNRVPPGRPDAFYKTTNSGLNWVMYSGQVAPYGIVAMDFTDENTGYACGFGIYKTTNCGNNWIWMTFPPQGQGWILLNDINFTSKDTGYAVGYPNFGARKCVIIKTTNGGGDPFGIEPISSEIPKSFMLYQNYPNPFNPTTKIRFQAPLSPPEGRKQVIRLVVYDIFGREVQILVNEQLKPGTYEVEWNGSSFSSGIYFYSLITDKFTETKRMVLIK